jgi:integrase
VAIKTEIEGFSFNVLRHTAAANWVRAGIPLKYIAEQLGHSVFVCERHYAHIAVDHRTEVFSSMPPGSFSREAEVARIRAGRSVA